MISASDVCLYDIVENADQRVTFFVYVYTKKPTDALRGKVLQVSIIHTTIYVTRVPTIIKRQLYNYTYYAQGVTYIILTQVVKGIV